MTEQQQVILERILRLYPEDKRQEAGECVMEYISEYSMSHTRSIESVLLYVEQDLLMGQLDQMPKNLNIEKLKDECDKAKENNQLPATRNTKPFYTKFLNKRHKIKSKNKKKHIEDEVQDSVSL